jgi:hypothetical protein
VLLCTLTLIGVLEECREWFEWNEDNDRPVSRSNASPILILIYILDPLFIDRKQESEDIRLAKGRLYIVIELSIVDDPIAGECALIGFTGCFPTGIEKKFVVSHNKLVPKVLPEP